jgi:uncharacterized protein (TIGR02246 family)
MRIPSLLALVGLAIGLAVRAFAQMETIMPDFSGNLAGDVKALEEFNALRMKEDEAFNKNDAAALAALFTEDALLVEPEGMFQGRQAIEKAFVDVFQRWHPTNFISEGNKLNAIGNDAFAVGRWWCTLESQNGPVQVRGYWSEIYVREGDAWKIRMLTLNEKKPDFLNDLQQPPRPASPAETK